MQQTGTIRWGIAGTGGIAASFARAMALVDGGEMVAVASRTGERAATFAAEFGIPRAHGTYEDLAGDPEVDAVYIATPHSRHAADSILYLEAGKHVLCEKPFTLNAAQARHVFDVAERNDRFIMEALWSRFLPPYETLGRLLAEGAIGRPLLVEADFGFRSEVDPTHRHFDLAQGGGALLDLGIYPVQLSTLVFGAPDRITADGNIGSTGVDEDVAAILHHRGGELSVLKASIRTPHTCTARIAGSDGVIEIPAFMHCPDEIVLVSLAGRQVFDCGWEGEGLRFEVDEVNRCLAAGLRQSPRMPASETMLLQEILDEIRRQVGVAYPDEDHWT
jgi:predicted dehydrogenase